MPRCAFRWGAMFKKIVRIALLVLFLLSAACQTQVQPLREVTLASGKRVKVLGVGQLNFANDSPALMLKYETGLKISDLPALRNEVEEIWPAFQIDVENAHMTNAIISANEVPQGLIFKTGSAYNFIFKKVDGTWRPATDADKTIK